ncbi:MAG: hypothetical protein WBC93_08395 [Sulfitobacter sp.]
MTLLLIGTWYLYAGGVVATVFLIFGLGRLDENAQGAWIFRPLLIPGVLLIWPLVIWRVWVLRKGEERLDRHRMPRKAQSRAALGFVCAIPLIIAVAIFARQDPSTLAPPILLEAAK